MLGRAGLSHVAQQEGRPSEAEGCGYLPSIWVVAKFRPFLMPWVSSQWCVSLAPRVDYGITGPSEAKEGWLVWGTAQHDLHGGIAIVLQAAKSMSRAGTPGTFLTTAQKFLRKGPGFSC